MQEEIGGAVVCGGAKVGISCRDEEVGSFVTYGKVVDFIGQVVECGVEAFKVAGVDLRCSSEDFARI
jgi:hypothetical protein